MRTKKRGTPTFGNSRFSTSLTCYSLICCVYATFGSPYCTTLEPVHSVSSVVFESYKSCQTVAQSVGFYNFFAGPDLLEAGEDARTKSLNHNLSTIIKPFAVSSGKEQYALVKVGRTEGTVIQALRHLGPERVDAEAIDYTKRRTFFRYWEGRMARLASNSQTIRLAIKTSTSDPTFRLWLRISKPNLLTIAAISVFVMPFWNVPFPSCDQ